MKMIGCFFAAAFLWGCTAEKAVVKIGDEVLTQKEIAFRNRLIRYQNPKEERELGLSQLLKAYHYAAILKKIGYPVTPAQIKAEKERIDQKTLMPDRLAAIKGLFKGDEASYLRVFVLPTLVERVLYYDIFLKDEKIQHLAFQSARDLIQELQSPKSSWKKSLSQRGLASVSLRVGGDELSKTDPTPSAGPTITEIISKSAPMKVGEVFPAPIDAGERLLVVIFRGKSKVKSGGDLVDVVVFPKLNFSEWLGGFPRGEQYL